MRHAGRITTGLLALALIGQAGLADQPGQDEKVDRKAIDTALYNTLREVINKGADMYNSGDMAGCYRLFEGALLTAKPMLDHRPELQKSIAKALTSADRDPATYRRAFALRAALDKIRTEVNPKPKKDTKLPVPKVEEKKVENNPDPEVKKPEVKKPDPEVKKPDPEVKKPAPKKPDPDDDKPDPDPKKPDPDTKKPVEKKAEPKKPDPDDDKPEVKKPAPEDKKPEKKGEKETDDKLDEAMEKLPAPKSEPNGD